MAAPMEQQDQTNLNPNSRSELWRKHRDLELVSNYIRNIRECDFYKEEYKECTSWRGRFHQRYVYGESVECDHFNNVYKACKLAKGESNEQMMDYVIKYELSKRDFRIESAIANNVWEYRKNPPRSWEHPGVNREEIPDGDQESQLAGMTGVQTVQMSPNPGVDNSAETLDDKAQMDSQALVENKSSSGCVVS